MYEVVDQEQDMAGRFRVRVLIGDQCVMLKFLEQPTAEEVQAEAARYDTMMQEQHAASEREALIRAQVEALMQEQANGAPDPE